MQYVISNNSELYHHGIKGQKWGVRRFQNPDGTYTNAGKERRNSLSDEQKRTLKKVATGALIGGAAIGLGVLAANNRDTLARYAQVGKVVYQVFGPEIKNKVTTTLSEAAKSAGKAAYNTAITAIGTVAIAKLTEKISQLEPQNDQQRIARDAALSAGKAGINSVVGSMTNGPTTGSSNTPRKGGPVSREEGAKISAVVGPPKQKELNRNSPEWAALFKDENGNNRDPDTRAMIKSMASAGYGIDQIQKYLDSFAHKVDVGKEYFAAIIW